MKRPGLAVASQGILGLAVRASSSGSSTTLRFSTFVSEMPKPITSGRAASLRVIGSAATCSYQAPLYPYFLAVLYRIIGETPTAVRAVHALLGAVSCALLSYAGWRMFGRRGLLAGAILAIYPAAIFLDGQLDKSASPPPSSAPSSPRLPPDAGGSPVSRSVLSLTRDAILLAIPLVISAATRHARLRFAAGVLLTLIPIVIRNYSVSHELHLTTAQSGPNFYIGNHSGAPGWYDPLVTGHGSAADERDDAIRLAEQASGRKLTPARCRTTGPPAPSPISGPTHSLGSRYSRARSPWS